jgi:non-heme chloroperoxidase
MQEVRQRQAAAPIPDAGSDAMNIFEIRGGNGLGIIVREFGNPDGRPILFIHGLMQCGLCWSHQVNSDLADEFRLLCMDVRGHGMSERAKTAQEYQDPRLFADDVAAVISTLDLKWPVLVGASYAGLIINDYVSHYGDSSLGGINYVAATVYFGSEKANTHLGSGLMDLVPGLLSADLSENISATRSFVRLFYATQPSQDECETVLAYNMVVPVDVRLALASREVDGDAVITSIKCPVLLTHGTKDQIVLPSMSEAIKTQIPHAELSFYDGAGHTTYGEAADRFNRELAAFVRGTALHYTSETRPHGRPDYRHATLRRASAAIASRAGAMRGWPTAHRSCAQRIAARFLSTSA